MTANSSVHLGAPLLVASCLVMLGCASAPPPRDFDLAQARIAVAGVAPKLDINSLPGGKAAGAGVGAASGSGWGALAGGAACLGTGPFIPLCLAVVLPTTTGIGALTGAAVGAARTETVGAVELKTRALAAEIRATPFNEQMAAQLRAELQRTSSIDVPLLETAAARVDLMADLETAPRAARWTLEVGLVEIGAEGNEQFGLRLQATALLRRDGGAPVWKATREVQSETELTLPQWLGNEAGSLHAVAEACLKKAAVQLAQEIVRSQLGRASGPTSRHSTSCDDTPPSRQAAVHP